VVGVNLPGCIGFFARLCAQYLGRAGTALGLQSFVRHNLGVGVLKTFALVLKTYRPFLSLTGSGLGQRRFFFTRSSFAVSCARREGFLNV